MKATALSLRDGGILGRVTALRDEKSLGSLCLLQTLSMLGTLARFSGAAAPAMRRFKLYTAPTPNGHQPSVMLEELKAFYGPGMDYEYDLRRFKTADSSDTSFQCRETRSLWK